MWWLCAVCALLLSPAHAGSAVCDDGRFNIQLDLPDESVFLCSEDYIPLPNQQVFPSIATRHKQENSYHVCMDSEIDFTAPIPNSGAHRSKWAKYGEYIYCPPQRWVHNLQHGGVAFLYHPCVQPQLKEALSSVARSCMPKHIITPLPTLSRERPIALATWCSTLEMSHVNLTEVRDWLRENMYHERQYETEEDGSYQHLLIRPSLMAPADTSLCSERVIRVLNRFIRQGARFKRHVFKKRRAALPVTPAVHNASMTSAGALTDAVTKNHMNNSHIAVAGEISPPNPLTPAPPVYLPEDTDLEGSKAGIHSREIDGISKAKVPELPVHQSLPTPGNILQGSPETNMTPSVVKNTSKEESHDKEDPPKPAVTPQVHSPESQQNTVSISFATSPTATRQPPDKQTDQKPLPTVAEKPPANSNGQKQECSCQQDSTPGSPVKAQRRLGAGQQKNADVFVSTPRTAEATWAAASLIFLLVLLTFSVLYTQIYKRFRKSQSLYWASGSNCEETETVASVIKRRLVQGHSKRKKWIGHKKSPVVLYESLSESSE